MPKPLFLKSFWPLFFSSVSSQFEYQEPVQVAAPDMGSLLLRLTISLIIVIGLAVLVIKFLQRQASFSGTGRWIRILDQVAIGPNRALILAEIAGKIYVLGVTDHNITKLMEIKNASQADFLAAEELDAEIRSAVAAGRGRLPFWKKSFRDVFLNRKNIGESYHSGEGD